MADFELVVPQPTFMEQQTLINGLLSRVYSPTFSDSEDSGKDTSEIEEETVGSGAGSNENAGSSGVDDVAGAGGSQDTAGVVTRASEIGGRTSSGATGATSAAGTTVETDGQIGPIGPTGESGQTGQTSQTRHGGAVHEAVPPRVYASGMARTTAGATGSTRVGVGRDAAGKDGSTGRDGCTSGKDDRPLHHVIEYQTDVVV